jgi:hypothetical protein
MTHPQKATEALQSAVDNQRRQREVAASGKLNPDAPEEGVHTTDKDGGEM